MVPDSDEDVALNEIAPLELPPSEEPPHVGDNPQQGRLAADVAPAAERMAGVVTGGGELQED